MTPLASSWARPVAGIAADEVLDGSPAVREILERYIGSPEFSNLPRKFKTAISGSPSLDVAHEVNDISFVGVEHPEHGPGFDVWVGGGLSTNPMFAQRLGVWVPLDEIPDVWKGVVSIFRDYGYRRLRNRARLKFLMADWGPEKFREVLEKEYLERTLTDGPAPPPPSAHRRDHVGVHAQQDGKFWVGVAPIAGRVSGTTLYAVAELASRHGSGRVRLTAHQKLLVLDVPQKRGRGPDRGPRPPLGLPSRPERVATRPDGLHRHRVLQARPRRDQGPRAHGHRRDGAAAARLRRAVLDPHQRLPQLLRPHPGRRRRPQGDGADRRRRQPRRDLPGPPRRRARHRAPAGPQDPGPQGARRGPAGVRRAPGRPLPRAARGDESFAHWAQRAEEDDLR